MKKDLIEQVVDNGLERAYWCFRKPSVIAHLLDLHWTETLIAEHVGVTTSAVSHWLNGKNRIRSKHFRRLIQLLTDTVGRYERRIEQLRRRGQWSEEEQYYMRYRLSDARRYLTNFRNWEERMRNAA